MAYGDRRGSRLGPSTVARLAVVVAYGDRRGSRLAVDCSLRRPRRTTTLIAGLNMV